MQKNKFHLTHIMFKGPIVPQCGDRKECRPEALGSIRASDGLAQDLTRWRQN